MKFEISHESFQRRVERKFKNIRWRCINRYITWDMSKDYRVIFNGLFLTRVYYNKECQLLLDYMLKPRSFLDIELLIKTKFAPNIQRELYRVIEALFKSNLIVPENYSEDKAIDSVRKEITKEGVAISTAFLQLSLNCNLRCPHCFIHCGRENSHYPVMTEEEINQYIEYFINNLDKTVKDPEIVFYGGEPCLYINHIRHSIEYAMEIFKRLGASKKNKFSIRSNGTIADEGLLKFLKKNDVRYFVSIDGFSKQHNRMRPHANGRGSFKTVTNNIRRAIEAGVNVVLLVTVTESNIDSCPRFLSWLKGKFGVPINVVVMTDNLTEHTSFSSTYLKKLDRLLRFCFANKWVSVAALDRKEALKFKTYYERYCNGIGSQISFLPRGIIGPCHGLSNTCYEGKKMCFLHLNKDTKVKNIYLWRKWNRTTAYHNVECYKKCPLLFVCGGYCPQQSIIKYGSLYKVNKVHCNIFAIAMRNQLLAEFSSLKLNNRMLAAVI